MIKNMYFHKKNLIIKIFFLSIIIILLLSIKASAADNTQIHNIVSNYLGIKNSDINFSKTDVSIDTANKTIDLANTSKSIHRLRITKFDPNWIYNFHDFKYLYIYNSDTPYNINFETASKNILLSGNTFKNTEIAISTMHSPKSASTSNQKNDYSKASTKSSKIGTVFTSNQTLYKITGNRTVTYIKTTSKSKIITIPSSVSYKGTKYNVISLSACAFKNNKRLKRIVIPNTIKSIETKAFENCINLKAVIIYTKSLKFVQKKAFKNIYPKAKFTVFSKSKKQYESIIKKIKKSTNRKEISFKIKKSN